MRSQLMTLAGLAVGFGFAVLVYSAATGTGPWSPSPALAEQSPEPAAAQPALEEPVWDVEWRGSRRYLQTDDGWHVWTPDSRWTRIPGTPDNPLGQ